MSDVQEKEERGNCMFKVMQMQADAEQCDLQEPTCGQCKERGIVCGGYDADRIFIYQDGGTSQRPKIRDATTNRHLAHRIPGMQLSVSKASESAVRDRQQPRTISIMLPESLMRSAYSEKTLDAFIQMYIPRGHHRTTNGERKELVDILPILAVRDEALQLAILAIGTAALGKSSNDEGLTRQGKAFYGKALTETAVALRNPARARTEPMLMVPRIMALFEILFCADPSSPIQANSWLSHAMGEVILITSISPGAYAETDIAHTLFVNARFRILISAIRTRKASILDKEEWKTLPWTNRIKTSNDVLIDVFCGTTELLEAVELLDTQVLGSERTERLRAHTIARAWTLHLQLQDWLATNPSEIYTPPLTDSFSPITFPNLDLACQTLRYWVISLLVYSCLDIVVGIKPDSDCDITHPNRPHPRMFARLIARSVSYFFEEQHGITGATTISFPLGMTLFYMKRNSAVDGRYMGMIMKAWNDPLLPSAIRDFLESLKQSVKPAAPKTQPLQDM